MFVITKKQVILVIAIILLAISIPAMVFSVNIAVAQGKIYTVVVDAGHGGIDGGVVGKKTGVKESDLNLQIAKLIKYELEKNNVNVVLTRQDENGLYGNVKKKFKQSDMAKRREIINNAKPDLMLSIHMNRWKDASRRGVQVFYDDTKRGEIFAYSMQNILNTYINGPDISRELTAQKGDYYIVKCTNYNSIIIECGFLSNVDDERNLCAKPYQERLAQTITQGALTILKQR